MFLIFNPEKPPENEKAYVNATCKDIKGSSPLFLFTTSVKTIKQINTSTTPTFRRFLTSFRMYFLKSSPKVYHPKDQEEISR